MANCLSPNWNVFSVVNEPNEQERCAEFCEQIARASHTKQPLVIHGGNSKRFYGRQCEGEALDVSGHSGILEYEPSELMIRARAGTRLTEIETALVKNHQMLPFEPPAFTPLTTIGGATASGLSGPRRPFAGAIRDAVLGVGLVNGRGELLHFGGQVMKNVAGYDLSRLMAGALGTLGLITDVSLRVLPRPAMETTFVQTCKQREAIQRCVTWAQRPLPLSAACWYDDKLYLRIRASEKHLGVIKQQLGDGQVQEDTQWWPSIRDQQHEFFTRKDVLWRLSLPPATAPLDLGGDWLIDWGGAQRWLYSDEDPAIIRDTAAAAGGHATLFRHGDPAEDIFHPLQPALLKLHQKLKQAFDPVGILNPGKLYKEL
jgi:glycolate oxidase FAD binding subunit